MSIRYRNYILFYLKTLCIVVLIFFNKHLLSQQVFYQDICNCGVTGAGFSTSTGFGSGSFDIYIEPGSIVNKAFLFIQRFGNAKETNIILNNKSYNFNYNNQVSANFTLPFTDSLSAVHAIDITGDIQTSQNTYDITIPVQNNQSINVAYGNVYLYVIYENPSLTPTTTTVFLNNYDMTHEEESYSSINLNPVNNNFPIGFATYTDRLGNIPSTHDGSYIFVENNLLGLIKGTDQVNNLWGGAGVKGHFYYQNNQLYGLDDDIPNNTMGGSDGLADISSYLSNLTTNLNWKLVWERPNTFPKKGTAPIQINLTNQSQNATDYSWWLNNEYQGNSFSGFYTDTSGIYEIELIAWRNDSICADTTSFTVIVFDSLVVTLPNVFTPNNDGVNDYFNIETNLPVSYELAILNRWGNVLFENNGKLVKGTHNLWDGKTKNSELVTDGTYFYIISFQLDEEEVNCEITECEVRKEGFVQVFGR